jgi:adenosylmethionine-8-amino-7-oxononanoate aminotransferase
VLLIVDEVMTGFGRTGRWFAIEEWEVRPDILVSGKGAGAGYWPLGLCVVAGSVFDTLMAGGGFVHGFTYSHSPIGSAVGHAVMDRIEQGNLLDSCRRSGSRLRTLLESAIGDVGVVGEIRGRGLLVGVEFVADRATREPMSRARRFTERLVGTSRQRGLLIYPAVGCADGRSGDAVLLAPPLNVTEEDIDLIVDRFAEALGEAGDR